MWWPYKCNAGDSHPARPPEKVLGAGSRRRSGRLWCRASKFNRVPEKVPEKVWEALVQSQVRFNRVPEKVWEGDLKNVWRRFWRRFREALAQSQVRLNREIEKVPEKVWEALVQSQVRFNRVPEKVPEKVPGSRGAKPSQVQRVPEEVAEAKPGQVHLIDGNPAEVFPARGFAARFRKICKNKTLRLLGIPPKFILYLQY